MLLGSVLKLFNINIGTEELTTFISVGSIIIGAIGVAIGRHKHGGVNWLGFKK